MAALTFRRLRAEPVRILASSMPLRALVYLLTSMLLAIPTMYAVVALPLLPPWAWILSAVERRRVSLIGQDSVADPPKNLRVPPIRNVPARLASGLCWREVAASLLQLLIAMLMVFFLTSTVTTSMLFLVAPALVLAGRPEVFNPWNLDAPAGALLALVIGVIVLVVEIYLVLIIAAGQAAVTRLLLDSRPETLEQQVVVLATEQIALIDAFETERTRIERDLHDGPQQHLASAALHLGILRERLVASGAGPAGFEVRTLESAHVEIEHALDSIRRAVAGLRPRTLADDGLGAALDELAARAPLQAIVDIDALERLPEAVEASLYSVAAEFTTNALIHGQAECLTIVAASGEDGTHLVLADDGVGGADPTRGTGLIGIAHRVRLLGGTFRLDSPRGGPTVLVIDVPEVAARGRDAA